MNIVKIVITGIGRLICDFTKLFQPNKVFVYGCMTRTGLKYSNYNWGDDINIYLLEELFDIKVLMTKKSYIFQLFANKTYCCIGSILGECQGRNVEIWGSGFISEKDKIRVKPRIVHSVRGPKTRSKLLEQGIDCPEIFGDPALLVSRVYQPKVKRQYKIGVIPHYIDEKSEIIRSLRERKDVLIISMSNYSDWHDIPDEVCSCERIISSSLHGIIVSDSYGIPNIWARFSSRIVGGDFKYFDYFLSIGRDVPSAVEIKDLNDFDKVYNDDSLYGVATKINYEEILEACPFKEYVTK